MKSKLSAGLFFFLSALHLLFIFSRSELTLITKPLLIPALTFFYFQSGKTISGLLVAALLACWIGDCLLMFTETHSGFFLAGLAAFMIGHVLYIFCFRSVTGPSASSRPHTAVYLLSAAPFVMAGWLIGSLWTGLGSFKIPVLCYTLVIIAMSLHAVRRFNRTGEGSFRILTAGAFLFMLSDSLLAYNMFGSPIPFSGLLVMSTYLTAQFLIVIGVLRHES